MSLFFESDESSKQGKSSKVICPLCKKANKYDNKADLLAKLITNFAILDLDDIKPFEDKRKC
jgi:glutaredoxin